METYDLTMIEKLAYIKGFLNAHRDDVTSAHVKNLFDDLGWN